MFLLVLVLLLLIAGGVAAASLRIVPAAHEGVVVTRGEVTRVALPGLLVLVPLLSRVHLVDIGERVARRAGTGWSRDRVLVAYDASVTYRVSDVVEAHRGGHDYGAVLGEATDRAAHAFIGERTMEEIRESEEFAGDILRVPIFDDVGSLGVVVWRVYLSLLPG